MTNLKRILKEQGRRQDWLAEKLGYPNSLVSYICTGKARLCEKDLKKVARWLGVQVDEIRD